MSSITGSLSKTFNHVVKGALIVGGFIVGGYLGSLLFDPFFFPIIHDPSNIMGQAMKLWTNTNFGAVHEWMGLTGSSGLLNTPWLQDVLGLKPFIQMATPAPLPTDFDATSILGL